MSVAERKIASKPAAGKRIAVQKPAVALAEPSARKAAKVDAGGKVMAVAFQGNVTDVIKAMRSGVKAHYVRDVAVRLGLSQERLFEQLSLPKSTMKGRIGKNETLSSSEQDRIYRTDKVWSRAVGVLEDENAARAWISGENRSLGGESPLSLLDTEAGYELVLDTLGRIEYGVVS